MKSTLLVAMLFLPLFSCKSVPMKNGENQSVPPLFKIISLSDWDASQQQDTLKLGAIDQAFIHLATREQLPRILAKFWPGDEKVVILELDPAKLRGRLVKERNPGGSTEFYHLYEGAIPLNSVVRVLDR